MSAKTIGALAVREIVAAALAGSLKLHADQAVASGQAVGYPSQ